MEHVEAQHLWLPGPTTGLGVDGLVSYLLAASKLPQQWQDALRDGKVTIKDCVVASKAEKDALDGLLALKLRGASAAEFEAAARKPRTQPTVKLDRVRLPLAGQRTATIAGEGLDIEVLIEILSTLLERARKALKDGLEISTLAKMLANQSKPDKGV